MGGTDATGATAGTSSTGSTGGSDATGGTGPTSATGGSGPDSGGTPGGTAGSGDGAGSTGGDSSTGGSTGSSTGGSGGIVTPGDPGAHDVLFTIDSSQNAHPISPYIYGANQVDFSKQKGITVARTGGNRLTAYNWETNASNAGSDYNYESDSYLSTSTVPGAAMKQAVQSASDAGASTIMTVPIAGWVAADEGGPVNAHPTGDAQIAEHFFPIANKGSGFVYPPDTTDKTVYEDEMVAWLESQFPTAQTDPARRIFYMLDNEPDLWSSTHSEIHPTPVTYAELTGKNVEFAKAIKNVAPNAIVFGPVNYGYGGFQNLQGATDANGQDWFSFYLDSMKTAEAAAGKRLVDVLDVHWYPEATGDGKRIIDEGTSDGEVQARLQAPRSLWDTSYVETSWITQCCSNGAIKLLPSLQAKIDGHYPGTKISVSEYNYGAGSSISGGVAQADVLGVFGREGVFAATMWSLNGDESFIWGGFDLFRNYDGNGGAFGDTSILATASDDDMSSVFASTSSSDPSEVIVVAINKNASTKIAGIQITHESALLNADVYAMTSAGPTPVKGTALVASAPNTFSYAMPGYSATTLVFRP